MGEDVAEEGHGQWRRARWIELLIDLEESKAARAVVFGLVREMERKSPRRRRTSG